MTAMALKYMDESNNDDFFGFSSRSPSFEKSCGSRGLRDYTLYSVAGEDNWENTCCVFLEKVVKRSGLFCNGP